MTEKVIHGGVGGKYAINKYQYRAFDNEDVDAPQSPVIHKSKQIEYDAPQPTQQRYETPSVQEESVISNTHAETFLQKIDELSSSLIKMEMQMERQQADFNARLEEERKRAYDDGFAAAASELDASYKAKFEDSERMLGSSVKKLEETALMYEGKLADIERELGKTAVSIAEQVIKKEVNEGSSKVALALVRELLSKLKDASKIKIKVSKTDAEYLRSALATESKITIEEDDAIQKGGIIVLSDIGNLDGNINARFLKVKEDLLGDHE